jgi:glycosyltransferase involved in cell wall biosynthesis
MRRELDELTAKPALELRLNEHRLARRHRDRPQDQPVSVILPTWNRAHILGRAIDSVLGQSYANFELIVSDDGSTDGTRTLIEERYADDPRVTYVRTDHGGPSHARNVALERASGRFVAYLDSDNEWSENYLLVMVNSLLDDGRAMTAYCGLDVFNRLLGRRMVLFREFDREALLRQNFIDINVFVHEASLVGERGAFREELPVLEDWDLVIRYTADRPPLVVPCILASYYLEEGYGHVSRTVALDDAHRDIRSRYGGGTWRRGRLTP